MNKTIYSKEHKYLVEQLKKSRKEAGLDQKEVAKLLRKTQSYGILKKGSKKGVRVILKKGSE